MLTTDFQTCLNMATTNLGVVLFALPYSFRHVGVTLTLTMIVLQYFWTKYCSYCLVETTKSMPVQMKEGTDPYLKLMRDNFGVVGARLLDVAYIIALYGAGLSYQISFGFSMAEMKWNPSWVLFSDYRFWTVLYLFIEIPLCLLRSLRSISFASLGSVIVMILCCVVIIIYGAIHYGFSWESDFGHIDSSFDVGKCFGLLSFGLAVNCLVPSSYVSMQHPERISPIISISIIFALSLYVAMGLLGLVTFNKAEGGINEFIMLNLPHDSLYFYISSGVLCAMLILITPIIVYPSSLTLDSWFQACCGKRDHSSDGNDPAANETQAAQETQETQEGQGAQGTEEKAKEPSEATVTITEGASTEQPLLESQEAVNDSVFINDGPGIAARVTPLVLMTIIAYVWPKFSNVVSITGASATSFVNFIFPTMLHFVIFRKEHRALAVLDVLLTIFGLFAAIVGTYMSMF